MVAVIVLLALIAIALILGPQVALWVALIGGGFGVLLYVVGQWRDERENQRQLQEKMRQGMEQKHAEQFRIHTEQWEAEQRAKHTPVMAD